MLPWLLPYFSALRFEHSSSKDLSPCPPISFGIFPISSLNSGHTDLLFFGPTKFTPAPGPLPRLLRLSGSMVPQTFAWFALLSLRSLFKCHHLRNAFLRNGYPCLCCHHSSLGFIFLMALLTAWPPVMHRPVYLIIVSSSVRMDASWGLFSPLFYFQPPEYCLTHSRHSVSMR